MYTLRCCRAMDNTAARHVLKDARLWAKARLAAGFGTPEDSYQYMKLIEAVDAILSDLEAENRVQGGPKPDGHLRVVEIRSGKEGGDPSRVVPPRP